ncbi:MAG: S9 family peptidase [candidate division WOR-3 bacterium]|nr:MAG: S9 family peptidase [candidate division WOR-3 bacterium]
MEDFFRNPDKARFDLSPNGEYLSLLKPWNNRLNVHVQRIGDSAETRVTSATEQDIFSYFWANDEQIVYVQDKFGDENYHLFIASVDGSEEKDLTPFDSVRVRIVDDLEDIEDEMIISMNRRDPRVFDVYRIILSTGELELIAENPGNVAGWMTDHDGKLRVAVTIDGLNIGLLYRWTEDDTFELLEEHDFRDKLSPELFTYDNKGLYVLSNLGRDKLALYRYDLEKRKLDTLVYEHPDVDIAGPVLSRKRKKLTGVYYITDKVRYAFLDDWRANLQAELEALIPGKEVRLSVLSRDETKALVVAYGDRSRGSYYYYETETKKFMKLADVSPWLNEEELAEMKPVNYLTRDSLTIHGYLTLPVELEPRNLPVVMLVHGGPQDRDYWGFRPEAQFLANRGYAVLQPNFRGSAGYGKEFANLGLGEWGRKMQDDITDGVNWLIEQGIADPDRVGIYGGSYGGYATLAGLAFTPELYACGIDYVGPSNLLTFMNTIPPYWEQHRAIMYEAVGDPEKDRERLEAVSPLFHVDKIRAPLFVAQGANDPRVTQAESDQMVEALRARGVEVEYMLKENEGHGFANEENRFDFYKAMELFLAKHLGGRVEKVDIEYRQ